MNTALSLHILVEPTQIRKRKLKGISEKHRLHYPPRSHYYKNP